MCLIWISSLRQDSKCGRVPQNPLFNNENWVAGFTLTHSPHLAIVPPNLGKAPKHRRPPARGSHAEYATEPKTPSYPGIGVTHPSRGFDLVYPLRSNPIEGEV